MQQLLLCSAEGCHRPARSDGSRSSGRPFCETHYRLQLHPNQTCAVPDCDAPLRTKGYCKDHYRRLWRYGDVRADVPLKRRASPGSGWVDADGYRQRHKNGAKIAEHRLVMEEHLGRSLLPGETVHHVNGDRLDNRLANLELWSSSQPPGQRVIDKMAWAIEILQLYAPECLAEGA